MPNAGDLTANTSRFIAMFVGPKHSGKTCAAASFLPTRKDQNRIRIFDFDGRINGLLGAPWIDRTLVDYDYYPPRLSASNKDNTKQVMERLNNDFDFLLSQYKTGSCPYGTVILDSLTAETFALLCDAIPLTHSEGKGKKIGTLNMAGPEDYGFEATGTYATLAFLRSVPAQNIIVTAHVIPRYGRLNEDDKYSERVIVGEQLSLRDKITANIGIYFDHIFRFDREVIGQKERHSVVFRSDLACTSFPQLPFGKIDITGKSLQEVIKNYISPSIATTTS